MELLRLLRGGLNLDDSVELMDPEDWSYAANIMSGRAKGRNNGEKENVRGTNALDIDIGVPVIITVEENNSFVSFTNQGLGISWSLGSSPVVELDDSETSKELNFVFSQSITEVFNVSFTAVFQNLVGAITMDLIAKNGATVVTTETRVLFASTPISIDITPASAVDNLSIRFSVGVTVVPNLNLIASGGDYELSEGGNGWQEPWRIPSVGYSGGGSEVTRDGSRKVSGNYSKNLTIGARYSEGPPSSGGIGGGSIIASGRVSTEFLPLGKQITVRAWVYTPSSAPIADSTYEFRIVPAAIGAGDLELTTVSNTWKTVADATNTWVQIEAVFEVMSEGVNHWTPWIEIVDPADPFGDQYPLSSSWPENILNVGGQVNIDEFYVIDEQGPYTRTVTLSDSLITRTTSVASAIEGGELIGVIRSAQDNVSYIFFYNEDPSLNCILKFDQGEISLVIQWEGLNFSNLKEHRINGGGVADGNLYFTDNYNEPRCINIERYSSGAVPVSQEEILHIKRGPQFAPEMDLNGSVPVTTKPVDDVQFAYQYEYLDGQLSVISPWTSLVKGQGMTNIIGAIETVPLRVGSSELIPATVSKIKYVARKNNTGTPFYIGEVSAPFDQSDYSVTYREQNLGVIDSHYEQAFELVPLLAKASCVTKSRAWFANYLEGYDTPTDIDISASITTDTSFLFGANISANSKYRVGAVFHDSQGRSCGVIDAGYLETSKTLTFDADRKRIQFQIEGTKPSWAKYVSFVMSKDLTKSRFYEGWGSHMLSAGYVYVTEESDGTYTYKSAYDDTIKYVRLKMDKMNQANIFYSYAEGDFVIITNTTSGTNYGPLKVRKVEGEWIFVDPVSISNAAFTYAFQVYTPNAASETFFYEVYRYGISGGLDSTIRYVDGDCTNVPMSVSGSYMPQMRFRANDGPWNTQIGKPYVITNVGQVRKANFIRHSSTFIPGIGTNGLSEFSSGDESNVPVEAVQIQKLQPTSKEATDGDLILAICNSDTYSIYIDEARVSLNDQSFVVNSTRVIGDVRKQRSGFGTLHPESVHEEEGDVFWYDHLARSYVRYASNGIFPISEYKAVNYFEEQAQLNDASDVVVTGYDPFYKTLFVTFQNAETDTKKTIAFSLPKERWISFFDFAPDGYVIGSDKMYSIKDGAVYSHDNTDTFNEFYGQSNDSEIEVSFNEQPTDPKEWKVIGLITSPNFYQWSNGNQSVVTGALRVDIENRQEQSTNILYNEFEVDENMIYGEIRGDVNTGTVLSGDPIYSPTIQVKATFSGDTYKQITALKAGCEISRGHKL